MPDTPKTRILALAKSFGFSESYGALLHITALLQSSPPLVPISEKERLTWLGHMDGLRSALCCLVMHEQPCKPQQAARIVNEHIVEARLLFCDPDEPGSGD